MALTKVPSNLDSTVATTQSASDNSTNVATTAYVTTAISNLVDSSPSALNTLNELAAALNDDASFSTTVNNSIATKLPLAGGTLTGALVGTTAAFNSGATNIVATFTSTDGLGGIQLADDTGNVELVANGNNFEVRNAGGAVKMVVENGGNVGIGNPSPGVKLDVAGEVRSTSQVGYRHVAHAIESGHSSAHSTQIGRWPSSGARWLIVPEPEGSPLYSREFGYNFADDKWFVEGNFGIGTTNADAKLHISGNSDNGDEDCMLIIHDSDSSAGSRVPAIMFTGTGGNHGRIRGSDSQGMILSGSSGMGDDIVIQEGKVAIGTNSPAVSKGLHINSNGNSELRLTTTQDSGTPTAQIGYSAGSGYFFRLADAANNEDIMLRTYGDTIFNGGNVGINFSSPNHILEANDGALGVTYPISVNNHLAGFNGRGSGIKFKSNTTEQCKIFYYHYGTIPTLFYDGDMHRFRNVASATMLDIGNTGNASLTGSLTQNASDERLKDKVTEIPNAIDKIKELKGVSFEWKGNGAKDFPHEDGKKDIGVIAQDVQKVLPEAVEAAPFDLEKDMEENSDGSFTEKVTSKSGKDYLTVNSEKLIPVLIQGIKELEARVKELEG